MDCQNQVSDPMITTKSTLKDWGWQSLRTGHHWDEEGFDPFILPLCFGHDKRRTGTPLEPIKNWNTIKMSLETSHTPEQSDFAVAPFFIPSSVISALIEQTCRGNAGVPGATSKKNTFATVFHKDAFTCRTQERKISEPIAMTAAVTIIEGRSSGKTSFSMLF